MAELVDKSFRVVMPDGRHLPAGVPEAFDWDGLAVHLRTILDDGWRVLVVVQPFRQSYR